MEPHEKKRIIEQLRNNNPEVHKEITVLQSSDTRELLTSLKGDISLYRKAMAIIVNKKL